MTRKLENQVSQKRRVDYVYFSNELARIAWNLSLQEWKILLIVLSKLNPFNRDIGSNKNGDKYSVLIKKSDIFEKFGIVSEGRYSRYKKVALGLENKPAFTVVTKEEEEVVGDIVAHVDWHDNYPDFEVVLNPKLMSFFECLRARYTKVPLDPALKLRSNRSLALFVWFCSYINTHSKKFMPIIPLRELKKLLGVPEEAYRNKKGKFNHSLFRLTALDPWISEFSELNLFGLKYEVLPTSKDNPSYRFSFTWINKDIFKDSKPDKKHVPILPIIRHYLKVNVRNGKYWAKCPFHDDRNPSLSISEPKNCFKCFACNVSGNAITFIKRKENCDTRDATKKAYEILGIEPEDLISNKEKLLKFNGYIAEIYHKCLIEGSHPVCKKALDYLVGRRKLNQETIKKYRIGFAPSSNFLNQVVDFYLPNHVLEEDVIVESGLFSDYYSKTAFFNDRIIFPIQNKEGQVIGFSGRGKNPKYLDLRSNSIFQKSKIIFNEQHLRKNEPIYIFEGLIDLMKADQECSCSNSIACLGGSLSRTLFSSIRNYTDTLVLCFDNDAAGRSFTKQLGRELLDNNFKVLVVDLLERKEKDIDEVIDSDLAYAKSRIDNPIIFSEWVKLADV